MLQKMRITLTFQWLSKSKSTYVCSVLIWKKYSDSQLALDDAQASQTTGSEKGSGILVKIPQALTDWN